MATTAALLLLVLLAALAVFQLALAFGAPLGRFAWGGQHRVLPTSLRLGSLSSLVIYALIGAIVAERADLLDVAASDSPVRVAAWAVAAYFLLGVVLNAASRSKAERNVMTPLCAVLCALSVVVASG
jgi:hypothetical protein